MDWVVASRPWSFTTSLIPIAAASTWLLWVNPTTFDWVTIPLAMLMLVIMQAAGNLISDYFDHVKGIDLPGSLNGVRHIQSGKFTPREVLNYGFACLAVGTLLGLFLVWRCGLNALWIGGAGIVMVLMYPWLKARALGDINVLLGYALLPAFGLCYAIAQNWMLDSILMILPVGICTVSILHANNTRDMDNDTRAGIRTLSITLGFAAAKWVYFIETILPYLMVLVLYFCGIVPITSFIVLLTLPLAINNIKMMRSSRAHHAEDIGTLDLHTAKHQMAFGILYTISFALALI